MLQFDDGNISFLLKIEFNGFSGLSLITPPLASLNLSVIVNVFEMILRFF